MAVLKDLPLNQKGPSLRGVLMIDTFRGRLRVRKWPKKRGKSTNPKVLFWQDWFRQANYLAKYVSAMDAIRAKELTKGTRLYPRDILLSAMRGRLFWWQDETGWKWFPMAAAQDISDSLDILSQKIGGVLVRATDRWRNATPDPATIGHVLTYQGAAAPPVWAAGGGGTSQIALPGTPITPDGTKSEYIFDVDGFAALNLILDNISLAASKGLEIRVSIDGGVTYKLGATDYFHMYTSPTLDAAGNIGAIPLTLGAGSSNMWIVGNLTGLQAPRASWFGQASWNASNVAVQASATRFDGPITHVKLYAQGGTNFTGGLISVIGTTKG